VRERGGNRRARLDLAWPEAMLAVEPAGARFHGGPRRQRADEARRAWLGAQGWLVIDVQWSDLAAPHDLVARIESAYRRRYREVAAERALSGALVLDFGQRAAGGGR
jgi:very-short-patch-repair endonuclease